MVLNAVELMSKLSWIEDEQQHDNYYDVIYDRVRINGTIKLDQARAIVEYLEGVEGVSTTDKNELYIKSLGWKKEITADGTFYTKDGVSFGFAQHVIEYIKGSEGGLEKMCNSCCYLIPRGSKECQYCGSEDC